VSHSAENDAPIRVGFRYRDGEVLSPEREAKSEDAEIPEAVLDLGDGEWLTLSELRDQHAEELDAVLDWPDDEATPIPPEVFPIVDELDGSTTMSATSPEESP